MQATEEKLWEAHGSLWYVRGKSAMQVRCKTHIRLALRYFIYMDAEQRTPQPGETVIWGSNAWTVVRVNAEKGTADIGQPERARECLTIAWSNLKYPAPEAVGETLEAER